tara:strand:+ start:166 stop:675 length:510 start_codon:yes stop_codon:yes gene_type:complete
MKITKNELKEIIREEALKFKRKIELENELNEVQSQINEVTGGPGTHVANDSAGTMYDKNVTLKGGALVEDDDDTEISVDPDGGVEISTDESYMSEEALEEMLSEIMSEDDDEEGAEEEPADEETDEVDEGIYEEEEVSEEEVCEEEEVSEEVISEEMRRMKELAGLLKS